MNEASSSPALPSGTAHDAPAESSALDLLAEDLAHRVALKLAPQIEEMVSGQTSSPWLTTPDAIIYTGIPEGTFRKLAACGSIPSHGGRTKLFYRPELDRALLESEGLVHARDRG